jgi:agmatine deiminase
LLLPDWQTDHVTLVLPTPEMYAYNEELSSLELFYADFLQELARHDAVTCLVASDAQAKKMERLSGVDASVFEIAPIPDIWIRDFAPFQATHGCVKFRYATPHSPKKLNRAIDAAILARLEARGVAVKVEDLALEGGNLTHNGRIGISTRRLFDRNRGRRHGEIGEELQRALGLERLVVTPVEPGDRTGHIDGMLRWIGEDRIMLNDYAGIPGAERFHARLLGGLDRELPDVERVVLPYQWAASQRDGWYDARGNYVNFLRTARRVYLPVYGVERDERAIAIFERAFPGRVSTIDARAIAQYGGSLHCITWNHVTVG